MTTEPTSPDETAADFARPVLERQLAKLERLADIGMAIAESLRESVAEACEPVDPVAIALAYNRVARAVRLTFALQITVADKLRGVGRIEDYEAGLVAQPVVPAAPPTKVEDPRLRARKDDIAATVTGIIGEIHKDAEAYDRCIREATERLTDAKDLGDILARPFEEVVAQICRDLGLSKLPSPLRGDREVRRSQRLGMGVTVAAQSDPQPVRWQGAPPCTGRNVSEPAAHPTPAEPSSPPIPTLSPLKGERAYTPPPDPDALPGYPVGLPGELPPRGRRSERPPTNYTYGFD